MYIMPRMKTGSKFQWMRPLEAWFPELPPYHGPSSAVSLPYVAFLLTLLLIQFLDIRVRSPQHEKVLRQEWMDAQAEGLKLEDINFEGAEEDFKA
jgi:hypothetical protein